MATVLKTRWGIVDISNSSHIFAASLSESVHELVAIVSLDEALAQDFAVTYEIPKVYKSYEEFAADENIEVVYITTDNKKSLLLDVARIMLNAGKHVLYKGPTLLITQQMKEIIELAKTKQLFVMLAIPSRCYPNYDIMRKEIENENIGNVRRVYTRCSLGFFNGQLTNEGLNIEEIIDFIEYSIQLALFTFGQVKPDWIHASREHKRSDKVITLEVNLRFPDYRQASFYYKSDGVDGGSPGSEIFGTVEKIKLSSFSTPNDMIMTHMGVEIPRPESPDSVKDNSGLVYMADEVRRCIEHGLIESPKLTNAETLLIAEILTEVYVKILSSWESESNIMDRYIKTI